jgi:hypothetical protein
MVHFDPDDILLRVAEADAQVAEVLGEFASRAFDCDVAGFDLDCDCEEYCISMIWMR